MHGASPQETDDRHGSLDQSIATGYVLQAERLVGDWRPESTLNVERIYSPLANGRDCMYYRLIIKPRGTVLSTWNKTVLKQESRNQQSLIILPPEKKELQNNLCPPGLPFSTGSARIGWLAGR